MIRKDDFAYAMEHTKVLLAPRSRIATFGDTRFRFVLLTELMDSVNEVRIRDGRIEAGRPQIVSPEHFSKVLLEGFGEEADRYAEWLSRHGEEMAILKYGFKFTRTDLSESVVRDSIEAVGDRVASEVEQSGDPLSAVIQGVDDAWEVCLLKFSIDLVQGSAGDNTDDFRNQGLL